MCISIYLYIYIYIYICVCIYIYSLGSSLPFVGSLGPEYRLFGYMVPFGVEFVGRNLASEGRGLQSTFGVL